MRTGLNGSYLNETHLRLVKTESRDMNCKVQITHSTRTLNESLESEGTN